jgi:hypothetical protein
MVYEKRCCVLLCVRSVLSMTWYCATSVDDGWLIIVLCCFGARLLSWLMHYATSRKVAGSTPDEVDFFS